MNCFYHHDRTAVGTCKSCGKGLCPACAVELPRGLACRDRCDEDVRALTALIEQNIRLSPASSRLIESGRRARTSVALFHLLIGAVFVGWGLLDTQRYTFVLILGGCFFAYGLVLLGQARRLRLSLTPRDPAPPAGPAK